MMASGCCDSLLILFQGYSDLCVGIPRPDCSGEGLGNGHLTWEGGPEGTPMGSLGKTKRLQDCFVEPGC